MPSSRPPSVRTRWDAAKWVPVTLREAARRVGRDACAVHSDVHMLLQAGVLHKDDDGRIEFPCTAVRVDFMVKAAA